MFEFGWQYRDDLTLEHLRGLLYQNNTRVQHLYQIGVLRAASHCDRDYVFFAQKGSCALDLAEVDSRFLLKKALVLLVEFEDFGILRLVFLEEIVVA